MPFDLVHNGASKRMMGAAATALRIVLAFLLAFGTTLYAESAYAPDAFAASGEAPEAGIDETADENPDGAGADAAGGKAAGEAGDEEAERQRQEAEQAERQRQEAEQAERQRQEAGGGSSSSTAEDSPSVLKVVNIGIFPSNATNNPYTTARRPAGGVAATIEHRGGYLDLNGAVQLGDGSWEYQSSLVSWDLPENDGGIARVGNGAANNEFRLEAAGIGDGVVAVTASVPGAYTEDGADLSATMYVELMGQTEAKYVTAVDICDETGAHLDNYTFPAGTLATAQIDLHARVRVYDPATDIASDYLVSPGMGLGAQTNGELADIRWESLDSRLGYVSDYGEYRPLLEGTNQVRAYSSAGFNGTQVEAVATIGMPGEESGNYNPQDTLTVEWYWAKYSSYPHERKTYSIDDLEALGTFTYTYTAVRENSGYFTTTGRGPLLSAVLADSVGTTEGIARLRFGTPDNYQGVVSWDMLVDKDRYYFPNIDVHSLSGKVQVPPIIAIESHRNSGTDVAPNYDMDAQRRFLLLFGAKDTGEVTTNLQVYNIHTLYVELAGAPPVQQNGDGAWTVSFVDSITGGTIATQLAADPDAVAAPEAPEHEGYAFSGWSKDVDERSKTVVYTAQYAANRAGGAGEDAGNGSGDDGGSHAERDAGGEGDDAGRDGAGTADDGRADGAGSEGADAGTPAAGASGPGGEDAPGRSKSGAAGASDAASAQTARKLAELSASDVQVLTPGRWSMLQAINRHPANISDLMLENPLAPYAFPVAVGILFSGAVEAFVRFRWQKRMPHRMQAA